MNREIKLITPQHIEDYLTIYLNAYPAYKDIGDEGREKYRPKILNSMENDKHIHFYGLFEDGRLIATMKLIDFSVNLFGRMQTATGLMALGVHPLHKKKGAALEMVRFFEDYVVRCGNSVAMLLPFRMDFYRKMGYGCGSKLDEYRIPSENLPKIDREDMSALRFLTSSDVEEMIRCHSAFADKNHGMAEKFEDEIRAIEEDTQSRRIGCFEDGRMTGYVSYRLVCESDVNYTLNRMEVDELVYMDGKVLLRLLGYLRNQSDLAQTVVLRTGEPDFYHLLPSSQDISGNYIDFGFLQTNVSAVGTMYKVVDPEVFIASTGYRKFPASVLTVRFIYDDELNHCTKEVCAAFTADSSGSSWRLAEKDSAADVSVRCTLSTLSSLFMGSCGFSSLVRLGAITLDKPQYEEELDRLFYCRQKPWTNTDY